MERRKPVERSNRRKFFDAVGKTLTSIAALAVIFPVAKLQAANKSHVEDLKDPDAWFNQIKGKHKIVYDATTFHDGFSVIWSKVFLDSNNKTGTPDADLTAVVVFRHAAFGLALEDRIWSQYKLGKLLKVVDVASNTPSMRNPIWDPKEGEMPEKGMSIKGLQERGVMFCVCEKAITVNSTIIAKTRGLDLEEVKKELMNGVLPGIQTVPSGVWALSRAQEHGCAYCFAG